nr:uncharacterized protein LOC128687163 [Cherax quadricarinatus]
MSQDAHTGVHMETNSANRRARYCHSVATCSQSVDMCCHSVDRMATGAGRSQLKAKLRQLSESYDHRLSSDKFLFSAFPPVFSPISPSPTSQSPTNQSPTDQSPTGSSPASSSHNMLPINTTPTQLSSTSPSPTSLWSVSLRLSTPSPTRSSPTYVKPTKPPLTRTSAIRMSPTSESPTYLSPNSHSPICYSPTSLPPTKQSSVDQSPATESPATESPPTESPATESPPTESPPTESPPTESPPTESPASQSPVNRSPTSQSQITQLPANHLSITLAKSACGRETSTCSSPTILRLNAPGIYLTYQIGYIISVFLNKWAVRHIVLKIVIIGLATYFAYSLIISVSAELPEDGLITQAVGAGRSQSNVGTTARLIRMPSLSCCAGRRIHVGTAVNQTDLCYEERPHHNSRFRSTLIVSVVPLHNPTCAVLKID